MGGDSQSTKVGTCAFSECLVLVDVKDNGTTFLFCTYCSAYYLCMTSMSQLIMSSCVVGPDVIFDVLLCQNDQSFVQNGH